MKEGKEHALLFTVDIFRGTPTNYINNINHHHFSSNTYIKWKWYSSFVHYLHTINNFWARPETKTTQSISSCSFYLSALLFGYIFFCQSSYKKLKHLKVFRMSFHAQITAHHQPHHNITAEQSTWIETERKKI